MTDTSDAPGISAFQPSIDGPAWRLAVRKGALVYLFSRVCVIIGAALVAAELRADDNVVADKFPRAPWADPDYANSNNLLARNRLSSNFTRK
jgi:hypothetical protein